MKRRLRAPRAEGESGQALVESALVMPLMIFFILGIVQLGMLQHAKIMTEYAAFNAARAGIVWNADPFVMQNAAIISLLPTQEGLLKEGDVLNPMALLRRIMQRVIIYQVNRRISQAMGWIGGGVSSIVPNAPNVGGGVAGAVVPATAGAVNGAMSEAGSLALGVANTVAEQAATGYISSLLGGDDDQLVRVDILNPHTGIAGLLARAIAGGRAPSQMRMLNMLMGNASGMYNASTAGTPLGGSLYEVATGVGEAGELAATHARSALGSMLGSALVGHFQGAAEELDFDNPAQRAGTLLTIRVRYMYLLRIPFANWIIHNAYMAAHAGRRLYGAIWNPQADTPGETGFRNVNPYRARDGRYRLSPFSPIEEWDLELSSKLASGGRYTLPLYASYSMRMQSNPYRMSLSLQ